MNHLLLFPTHSLVACFVEWQAQQNQLPDRDVLLHAVDEIISNA